MEYKKQLLMFHNNKFVEAKIRSYNEDDINVLIAVQKCAFPPPFPPDLLWSEQQLTEHIKHFKTGCLCVEVDGEIVGSITSLIINYDEHQEEHTWDKVTDQGYIRNHNEHGDTLYVVDICVAPSFRKLQLGKWLVHSLYEVAVHYNLKRLLGGARMPHYSKYKHLYSPEKYIEKIIKGEIIDPVVTFLLKSGRTPLTVVPNYLEDEHSCHYALLMEWKNPLYKKDAPSEASS
ncbi:GNAT family N-acetyltransferase [Priestia filamentosa]|uniref:Acetyltransferase n=1 Tax=Priestia filamentosa TaxID=1402861 RepID=A0A1X7F0A7_9BACI|nr:GNAT family N-acetyltransferase [Priestia filamentosa]AKO91522.1 acetyltransferase [Priestia filamentosa]MDT3761624.1 GNAT family N-acetyltransferase [Priestia filamentosa]OXS67721.1 GNAT family N-acetyltransferase [Priestia filamentosa]WRU96142.1 GNAT family N-acetyltransferase [Priestia filamentosa]SMF43184.1 Acetyltransferase (GNAT) family protein [Priestia filamentosa]